MYHLKMTGTIPSLHSCEISSKQPYRSRGGIQEAGNTSFCPSEEKFHTFVSKGVWNISGTL
jgi:hypothetical protein